VGGDKGRVHLGAGEEFMKIGGEKIRLDVLGELFTRFFVNVAKAQPLDARIIGGDLGADAPDFPAADEGEADRVFGFFFRDTKRSLVD
jgi:hypothetical protein